MGHVYSDRFYVTMYVVECTIRVLCTVFARKTSTLDLDGTLSSVVFRHSSLQEVSLIRTRRLLDRDMPIIKKSGDFYVGAL